MTPRPGVDLEGLSTFDNPEAFASGTKLQMIDTSQLKSLQAIADEFPAGHVTLAPPDPALVEEWAATRGTEVVSPYTQEIIDAIVGEMRAP